MLIRPFEYPCVIVSWYDGDSPTINIDQGFNDWKMNQKIRLYGVDTPELRGDERERGLEVRDLVRKWCPPGMACMIRTHHDKTGKFGRWLGEIYPPGWSQSVNQRLYREGLAEIEAYTPAQRERVKALLEAV